MRGRAIGLAFTAIVAVIVATRADAPVATRTLQSSHATRLRGPGELSPDAAVERLARNVSVLAASAPLVAGSAAPLVVDAGWSVSPTRAATVPEPPVALLLVVAATLRAAHVVRGHRLQ